MSYTTRDAQVLLRVSAQTIRNWTREFDRYLSVTATPEVGRTRLFTDADMQVLDLVARLKAEGKQYDEIHAGLQAEKRGNLPGVSHEEIQAMVSGEVKQRLQLDIQMLKCQIELARESQEALRRLERETGEAYCRRRLDEACNQFKQTNSDQ